MVDWNKYMRPIIVGQELEKTLMYLPEYSDDIRESDMATRLMRLSDIYQIFIPSVMSAEIYHRLYMSTVISLQKKETKDAILQQKNNFLGMRNNNYRGIIGGADSFTIIGQSGLGKSSAIERAVSLINGDDVIKINSPHIIVIPILQVQCPFDCSPKAMLLSILKAVDDKIGSNYYISGTRAGVTTDTLIGLVSQVALNHIGTLIIDEIQNIVKSKKGGQLVGMLMQLINSSGIGIAMVGTPESAIFFESEMQLARRTIGLKYYAMDYTEDFSMICKTIFRYQFTRERTELTNEIEVWLYEHSQGIIAVLVALVHDAQEIAIVRGIESLNIDTLSLAYAERMSMLHGRMAEKKKGKPQTSGKIKKNIESTMQTVETLAETDSLVEIVGFCKRNNLDAVKELSKYVSVEVIAV